ncbi:MAG: DUF1501 domain-containing protein [Planctomycetota bacterium]|nr:DUF1501 domain-containing protein [Planctomycetota bacterium]
MSLHTTSVTEELWAMTRRHFNYCDGITRREMIRAGMGVGGALSLPGIMSLQAASQNNQSGRSNNAVIFVEMAGGPTQHETYDPKPKAPTEYRGPFGVINTTLPGVQFSELMTRQSQVTDRLALVRSVHHQTGSHTVGSHLVQTGYYLQNASNVENDMPCMGSVIAKVRGANAPAMPPFVSIPSSMRYGRAAWLGKSFNPFETGGKLTSKNFQVPNLELIKGISTSRLEDRRRLLAGFDSTRRILDNRGFATAQDSFTKQAYQMVTTTAVRDAFDLKREDQGTRDLYGNSEFGQGLLLARRLAERGVPFVTVGSGGWDNHGQKVCGFTLEQSLNKRGPYFDQGVAGLVTDLYQRGLDQQILLVCMGEFGRTPKVNSEAGRDHWGAVMTVLISGGGLQVGQVIGASDSKGGYPIAAPYGPNNVQAMIYRHLGIDPSLKFPDPAGRPRYVLEERGLIDELI